MTLQSPSQARAVSQPTAPRRGEPPTANLRAFMRSVEREHDFESLRVEGEIPCELRGTLVRNGVGLYESFGQCYGHPFEGDGALCAVRLGDGAAQGAHRVTQSEGLIAERAAGRPLFSTLAPWHRRLVNGLTGRFKNTANTSVLAWQGRLLALMEAAPPTEIDPQTLTTMGPTDLGGAVPGAFSAHPHRVEKRRAGYNFGVRYGKDTRLDLIELPDRGPARLLSSLPLARPVMLHDFIATEKHLVFFVSPSLLRVKSVLLGSSRFEDYFYWEPKHGTEVIVVPIDRPDEPIRFEVSPFYQWHFANAFESGDEVIVDFVHYAGFDSFHELGVGEIRDPGTLHRARVSPRKRRLSLEQLWDVPCEFPQIDSRVAGTEGRFVWLTAVHQGHERVARFDLSKGMAESFRFDSAELPSEPIFVPRGSAEDDGWVLVLVYDDRVRQSHLAVFDGQRLEAGPVGKAWFDHHVPMTFHGTWLP